MCLSEVERARQWLFGAALPFWLDAGVDRTRGGFHEALDLDGRPADVPFRRLRVTCRQIYVFSQAARLGWADGLPAAADGLDWLLAKGWQGQDRGWARLLTPDGAILDGRPDLYDHAFVLFALGWHHLVTGGGEALAWAHRTLDFVETNLRHPSGRGFVHTRPTVGWRVQNPHMHLLEAALVLWETSRDTRFAALAHELADLFLTRFYDPRTGTVAEAYTDTLERAPGEAGLRVEPGHCFEWAWLLARYEALLGRPQASVVRRLVAFAEGHGVDPVTNVTWNAVRRDGTPVDRGSRTWPNTERVRAHVALHEVAHEDPRGALSRAVGVLLERHLSHVPRGAWMDHFDAEARPVAGEVPSSTLYHLVGAFAELLRVEPALRALDRAAADTLVA